MKRYIVLFSIFLLAAASAGIVSAAEPTAQDIIKEAEDLMRGQSNVGTMTMTVYNPRFKKPRAMTMDYWEKGKDKSLVKITAPAKDAGTISLKVDQNMWNYIPSIERTMKIPPSMMMQSWMGSDFTNDDLVKESSISRDYTATITGKKKLPEGETYMLELIPKPEAAVVWGKIIAYVRVTDHVPLMYEYYDEKGKLIRVMELTDIKPMGGRVIPCKWTLIPQTKKGLKTEIVLNKIEFNVPISDDVFSRSKLEGKATR
jgi:outer membrane lipoprotein-sorting protein